jgi:16S rRNA (cytidine1402-2'-O)-methyltransferase
MLTLVPTPIGNIADTSLRTIDTFANADIILCEDTRVTKKLIMLLSERYGLRVRDPRFISVHSHNEKAFIEKLEPSFFNQNVVYASDAGMPGVSDPAQALVRYCIENAVEYDVLPGANAVLTAFVASGFVTTQMLFYGFLPHKGGERSSALQEALFNGYTTVLYESPHRLMKLLDALHVSTPKRQIFLAKEISKKYQTFYRGVAQELIEKVQTNIKGEWVVVIEAGEVHRSSISEVDILAFNLPKKVASKLISKITGENPKACYNRLINNEIK